MLPLILAGAIWTYNICKIAERASLRKSDEGENPVVDEDSKESEDNENITISNSAEAIKYLKNQQKSGGQRNRADWGGERYEQSSNKFKRRQTRY